MDDSNPDYTVILNRANSPTASFSLGQGQERRRKDRERKSNSPGCVLRKQK